MIKFNCKINLNEYCLTPKKLFDFMDMVERNRNETFPILTPVILRTTAGEYSVFTITHDENGNVLFVTDYIGTLTQKTRASSKVISYWTIESLRFSLEKLSSFNAQIIIKDGSVTFNKLDVIFEGIEIIVEATTNET